MLNEGDIMNEVTQLLAHNHDVEINKGLFVVRPVNDWINQAKGRPIPKMLFGEFWHEGELCILFADTNLGKSILAVQIATSISEGNQIPNFRLEAEKQAVLYFDFELSEKQFEARYANNYQNHYKFDDNFRRAEINPERSDYKEYGFTDFDTYLNNSLEQAIKDTGVKVLIIDNITYLKDETEKAKSALPLMKHLQALKKKYGLSILALAHTPKRDQSKPITKNDLQGSKMLINFCDSAFAIGESYLDKATRYLKQIKARNTEMLYDTDNTCVCLITKPDNFLRFEFMNFGKESEHLKQPSENEKNEFESSIKALLESDPNITAYAIARKLCTDESKFNSFKVKTTRIVNRIRNSSNN